MPLRNAREKFSDHRPVGPAGHEHANDEVAGIKFGSAAVVDLNDHPRQWVRLDDEERRAAGFLKDQVAYYLLAPGNTGAKRRMEYADSFETLTANLRLSISIQRTATPTESSARAR